MYRIRELYYCYFIILLFYNNLVISNGENNISSTSDISSQRTNCQKCYYEKQCTFPNAPTLSVCRTIMTDNGIVLPCCCREGTICDNTYNITEGYDPTKHCRCKKDASHNNKSRVNGEIPRSSYNSNSKYNPYPERSSQIQKESKKNNSKGWLLILFIVIGIALGAGVFFWLRKRRQQQTENNNEDKYGMTTSPRGVIPQTIPLAQPIGTSYPGAATTVNQPIGGPSGPIPGPAPGPMYIQQQQPHLAPVAGGSAPVRAGMGAGASALLGGAAGLGAGMLLANAFHSHNHQSNNFNNDGSDQHVYHHHYDHGQYNDQTGQQQPEYTDGIVGTGYDDGNVEYEAGEF